MTQGAGAGRPRRFGSVVRRFSHGATLVNFMISEAADRVVGLARFDRDIYVWRLSDGKLVNRTPRKLTSLREPIAFIDGGRKFVTVPTDRTDIYPTNRDDPLQESSFSVFDSASGSLLRQVTSWKLDRWVIGSTPYQNSSNAADELHASRDGMKLVGLYKAVRYSFLQVFDIRDFSRLRTIYFDRTTHTRNNFVALSEDGRQAGIAGNASPPGGQPPQNWISLVDLGSGSERSRLGPFPGAFNSISLTRDASMAVTTNQRYRSSDFDRVGPDELTEVRVSSFAGNRVPGTVHLNSNSVPNADWNRDGSLIVAGPTHDQEVVLLDAATLSVLDTCPAHECSRVRFVGDRNQVAYINNSDIDLRDVI